MLVITREQTRYGHPLDECLGLHCSRCGKHFTALEEAYLAYECPPVGGQVEPCWCHKKCGAGEGPVKMVRGDWALRRLIESLVQPAIPRAALQENRARRPWGSP